MKRSGSNRLLGGILDHHAITGCIFLCTLACYIERMGFSIAFTDIARTAEMSERDKGQVLSAFFCGYAAMQIPGGWLSSRHGGSRILRVSFASWGLISLAMPGTLRGTNGWVMTGCRVAVGASQGLFIPASHTLLAQWIPVHERSRLVSLAMSGMYIGQALAMLVCPYVVEHAGPTGVFRLSGILAMGWLFLWWRVGSDRSEGNDFAHLSSPAPRADGVGKTGGWVDEADEEASFLKKVDPPGIARGNSSRSSRSSNPGSTHSLKNVASHFGDFEGQDVEPSATRRSSIPWGVMMRSPAVCAIIVTNFAFHYATYVLMSWLPTYFEDLLRVSLYKMGYFKVLPYVMMFIASNLGGSLGSWINIHLGKSIVFSRKAVNTMGFSFATVSLLLMPRASGARDGILYTTLALSSLGLCRGGWAVNHMDIAPRHAGVVMAIANGAGTLAGVVGVSLTGSILELMGGTQEIIAWSLATGVVAFVCLSALVTFLMLARGEILFH